MAASQKSTMAWQVDADSFMHAMNAWMHACTLHAAPQKAGKDWQTTVLVLQYPDN